MTAKRMKRASYRDGIDFIAWNDSPADEEGVESIRGYISTILLANLFGVDPERVARDVVAYRKRHPESTGK